MKRFIAFVLSMIMLAGALASCNTVEPAETTAEEVLTTAPATDAATEPETEPDTTVRIGETPLAEYTVVYGEGYEATATELAARLGAICGSTIAVKSDSEAATDYEIAIFARGASADGDTSYPNSSISAAQ